MLVRYVRPPRVNLRWYYNLANSVYFSLFEKQVMQALNLISFKATISNFSELLPSSYNIKRILQTFGNSQVSHYFFLPLTNFTQGKAKEKNVLNSKLCISVNFVTLKIKMGKRSSLWRRRQIKPKSFFVTTSRLSLVDLFRLDSRCAHTRHRAPKIIQWRQTWERDTPETARTKSRKVHIAQPRGAESTFIYKE